MKHVDKCEKQFLEQIIKISILYKYTPIISQYLTKYIFKFKCYTLHAVLDFIDTILKRCYVNCIISWFFFLLNLNMNVLCLNDSNCMH